MDQPECYSSFPDAEFLSKIAARVAELFPPGSDNRAWFQQQIETAIEQWKAAEKASKDRSEAVAKHYREFKSHPEWMIAKRSKKGSKKPPEYSPPQGHPDWVWGSWGEPIPDDPTTKSNMKSIEGWGPGELLQNDAWSAPWNSFIDRFGVPAQSSPEIIPPRCYLLAMLHDLERRGKTAHPFLQPDELPSVLRGYLYFDATVTDANGRPIDNADGPRVYTNPKKIALRETINDAIAAVEEELKAREAEAAAVVDTTHLTPRALAVYRLLEGLDPLAGMTGEKIIDAIFKQDPTLNMDTGTLDRIVRELKPLGLGNKARIGYFIRRDHK